MYTKQLLFYDSINPLNALNMGLFINSYPAQYYGNFIFLPHIILLYIIIMINTRIFKSKKTLLIFACILITALNVHATVKAEKEGYTIGKTRVAGHELYAYGSITHFGYFIKNVSPETFLFIYALLLNFQNLIKFRKEISV